MPKTPDSKFHQLMSAYERALIVEALRRTRGSVHGAAADLGLHNGALWRRLKAFNIDPGDYRPQK